LRLGMPATVYLPPDQRDLQPPMAPAAEDK
jgi:hypothetical protein